MPRRFLPACFFLLLAGCATTQLRERTARQAPTVTDLYYQQVVDNIALLHERPATLPYFSVAGTGLNGLQRTATVNYTLNWDLITSGAAAYIGRYLIDKQSSVATGSQANTDQWTTATSTDPDDLEMMRCAYLRVLGCRDADCCKQLFSYLGADSPYLGVLQPGWYGVGRKCDVPKCACYVGHHCDTYVWILPEGVKQLSSFTLLILDIIASESFTRPDADAARIKELEDQAKSLKELLAADAVKMGLDSKQVTFLQDELRRAVDGIRYRTLSQELHRYKEMLGQLSFCPETIDDVAESYYARKAARRIGRDENQISPSNVAGILNDAIEDVKKQIGNLNYAPSPPQQQPRPKKNFFNPYAVPGFVPVP